MSPRWLIAHFAVTAIAAGCVALGVWQLDRLTEIKELNARNTSRYELAPQPIEKLMRDAPDDISALLYRRTTVSGTFRPDEEVLIRSQVRGGTAGFDVVTPMVIDSGEVVAVNRGWVPLEFDEPPVVAAPPPSGHTTVAGVVRLSRQRGALGRDDSVDPTADVLSRVDLDLLDRRFTGTLLPVYVEVVGEIDPTILPVPAAPPDFSDEGSHLAYAIQWFSFALVGVVGYGFLLRRARRQNSDRPGEIGDHFDAGQPGEVASAQTDLGRTGAGADHD